MIKRMAMTCTAILLSGSTAFGQDWQAVFNLDSMVGYSTNTYMNPFISDWDPSANAVYGVLAPAGYISMSENRFSSDLTGSLFFEPVYGQPSWKGGFGVLNTRYRITDNLFAGAETGGSYFSGTSKQKLVWIVPAVIFSPSLFTQFRIKAGSSFRENSNEETGGYSRFDSYALEMETWPRFNWQLNAGAYGSLDQPANNLSTVISVSHIVTPSLKVSLRTGLEQYHYQVATETGGGGPPIGGGRQPDGEISDEADRFFRAGISGTYQLNRSLGITLNADHLNYFSTVSDESPADFHFSAGVRYSFNPAMMGSKGRARAEWKQNGKQTIFLRLKDADSGQLYIMGDFNDWEHPGVPLSRQKRDRYAVQLSLEPGAYEYKILLIEDSGEERWIELSDDTYTVPDGFDGENGLIFIE